MKLPIRRRHPRWSLQARLITAVVSFVSVILISTGMASGALLGGIVSDNLDSRVLRAQDRVDFSANATAEQMLERGPAEPGTLVITRNLAGTSSAYIDEEGEATPLPLGGIGELRFDGGGWATHTFEDIGEYRIHIADDPSGIYLIVGMPTSEVSAITARVVTTVTLLTAGGLLVLAAVIALIIRSGLQPLRSVANTATRVAATPMAEGAVRISERVPDEDTDDHTEIGRVGLALNTLLDHVDTSLAARQRNEERMRAFVADASHELRTPLASIRGYSELSLRGIRQQEAGGAAPTGVVAEATRESLERIQAQSLRMSALVEDLLLLARLDEGKELVYGAVDLTRLAVEAVSDARVAGADHDWIIDVPDEPVIVAGDTSRLTQVTANLLANARVHTPAGTTVSASVAVEDGDALLRIHDDGPGINPEIADELFERFSRADTSRARQTGGTGLGLSIAKAIVDGHGGVLSVASEPGSTTFTVRLPARPVDPAA